jgi:drug/metabolite transporter (DMT)-like permease
VGQLFIKYGVIQLRGTTSIFVYFFNIYILIGLSSAVVASVSWIKALQYYELSYAYPFMSLSFLFIAILSALIFHEAMNIKQWVGLGIVLLGLYIGSR